MTKENNSDFPFADLLGLKPKKKLTPEQEALEALYNIGKQYGKKEEKI